MSKSIKTKKIKKLWGIKCKNYDKERFTTFLKLSSYVPLKDHKYLESLKINHKQIISLNNFFESLIKNISQNIELYKKEKSINNIVGLFFLLRYYIKTFFRNKLNTKKEIIREIYDKEYLIPKYLLLDPSPKVIYLKNGKFFKSSRLYSEFYAADQLIKVCKKYEFNNLLEVGVGDALIPFLFYLNDKTNFYKIKLFGIDLSAQRVFNADKLFKKINKLEKKKNTFFMIGDGTDLIFEDKSFDATFVNGTLLDCKNNLEKIISEMRRVSNYLIIREPIYNLQTRIGKLHINRSDYSIISLNILKKYGEIIYFENDKINELHLKFSTIILRCF